MESEHILKKIGDSKFFLVPSELRHVFNLDSYIYSCKIEDNGKKIIFQRIRPIEKLEDLKL